MILRLTNNYNLKMPEGSDVVNIEDLNYNTNVIDNTLLQNKNDILNIIEVTNSMGSEIEVLKDKISSLDDTYITDIPITYYNGWSGDLICVKDGNRVTLYGMLHGNNGILASKTYILSLGVSNINHRTFGQPLHNIYNDYIGTVEVTNDNMLRVCHSDLTMNSHYIGINCSWYVD